jgi:hypothetical protein
MSAIAQHLIMVLKDGRVIARSDGERRMVASIITHAPSGEHHRRSYPAHA